MFVCVCVLKPLLSEAEFCYIPRFPVLNEVRNAHFLLFFRSSLQHNSSGVHQIPILFRLYFFVTWCSRWRRVGYLLHFFIDANDKPNSPPAAAAQNVEEAERLELEGKRKSEETDLKVPKIRYIVPQYLCALPQHRLFCFGFDGTV